MSDIIKALIGNANRISTIRDSCAIKANRISTIHDSCAIKANVKLEKVPIMLPVPWKCLRLGLNF